MPAELDQFRLASLAREMAMNIRNYKAVFADYGIDEADYYEIAKNEFYKRAKEQFALEWNSALSTNERVRLISSAILEPALPVLGARMLDRQEPLPAATEVAKFLARNAGLGEAKSEPKASERFVIQINLGADTETYNKSIAVDANDISPDPRAVALAAIKENPNGKADDKSQEEPILEFVRSSGQGEGTRG